MAKFLITGVAGFIGSNLAHTLVKAGMDVVGVDNLINGKRENVEGILDKARFITGDLCDPDVCREAIDGVNYVIHLAALGSVPRSIANPGATLENNVMSTVNILEAAKNQGVERFVFASSASVYGDSGNYGYGGKTETMTTNPINPYALSKLTCELLVRQYWTLFGMKTISLRYFNVFGPRQRLDSDYAAVVPKFIGAMLAKQSPTIFGDGQQTRDFTYVDNVVHANVLACNTQNTNAFGSSINVCCGMSTSVLSLFTRLAEHLDFSQQPVYEKARVGDIKNNFGSYATASEFLGYVPSCSVNDGLRQTVKWYRGQLCRS